jgi:gliding motility-associated-like protein
LAVSLPKGNTIGFNFGSPQYGGFDISCNGKADGIITPILNSANKIVSYKWTFPDSSVITSNNILATPPYYQLETLNNLKKGNYTIEVKDTFGCLTKKSVTLTEPASLKFTKNVLTYPNGYNVQCEGDSNGQISITNTTGGHGGYQYIWAAYNGGSGIRNGDALQNNLTSGNYKLTIQDGYCSVQDSFILTQPPRVNISFNIPSYNGYEIPCKDSAISVSVDASGGFSTDFTYQWSSTISGISLPASKDQNNLKKATYTVTVTNGNVCSRDTSFTLNEPPPVSASFTTSTSSFGNKNIDCHNGTGYIALQSITGGVPDYTFNWTAKNGTVANPASGNQNALLAGEYQVQVSDQNKCLFTKSFILTEPDSIRITFNTISPSCQNDTNGRITALVTGGVPYTNGSPYIYQWSTPGNTSTITGLKTGNYVVTVTDRNKCSNSDADSLKISSSPLVIIPDISLYNGENISCSGGNDGEIKLDILGGSSPLTFKWSTINGSPLVASSQNQTKLSAGEYAVTITDNKGCTKDTSFTLSQPTGLALVLDSKTDVMCHGEKTGMIAVTGSGGIPPYSYKWSGGQNTQNLNNVTGGIYNLTFTDANRCKLIQEYELNQPDTIIVTEEIVRPYCSSTEDGEIRLIVKGGISPYAILWDTRETTSSLDHLRTNVYTYRITDANNCRLRDTVNLLPHNQACLDIPNAFSPNGDLINDTWEINAGDPNNPLSVKELYPGARIEVFTRWGTLVYRSDPGYPVPWNGTYQGRQLPLDSYYYVVDTGNGKPLKGVLTIIK